MSDEQAQIEWLRAKIDEQTKLHKETRVKLDELLAVPIIAQYFQEHQTRLAARKREEREERDKLARKESDNADTRREYDADPLHRATIHPMARMPDNRPVHYVDVPLGPTGKFKVYNGPRFILATPGHQTKGSVEPAPVQWVGRYSQWQDLLKNDEIRALVETGVLVVDVVSVDAVLRDPQLARHYR